MIYTSLGLKPHVNHVRDLRGTYSYKYLRKQLKETVVKRRLNTKDKMKGSLGYFYGKCHKFKNVLKKKFFIGCYVERPIKLLL